MSLSNRFQPKMRVWLIVITILILLIAVPVGYFMWHFLPHTYNPGEASTGADVAHYTSVSPPPEARDFHVAAHEEGIARCVFVRFSAPVEVCRQYAEAVIPNTTLKPLSWDQLNLDQTLLYLASHKIPDLRWFDLPYAKQYWTLQSGQAVFQKPTGDQLSIQNYPDIVGADAAPNSGYKGDEYELTEVRIDVSRGVFYLVRSN